MNHSTYGSLYGKFHKCNVSLIKNNIIVLDLVHEPLETWHISRVFESENITIDKSQQPFIQALKAYFKSDVCTSVFCKDNSWTIILGNTKVIFPMIREYATFHLYATSFYVADPKTIANYLEGVTRPAYDNVYLYKNTILFLDNYDIPYPGGCYFHNNKSSSYFRICFLTNESFDTVCNLASEWKSRQNILEIPYLTKVTTKYPKFINFQKIASVYLSNTISSGIVNRRYSVERPNLLIHDILNSYFQNSSRNMNTFEFKNIGVILHYPFHLTFEGAKYPDVEENSLVALSVNGHKLERTLLVHRPYDRYLEYNEVPAVIWTPIYYVPTYFASNYIDKVIVENIVIGFIYNKMYFSLSYPLIEGRPSPNSMQNTNQILSVADDLTGIRVIQTFRYNEKYSVNRVNLPNVPYETWCLTRAEDNHPYSKNLSLPYLVNEWLNLFMLVGNANFDIKPSILKLALVFSKHKICYNLKLDEQEKALIDSDDINFHTKKEVINFINSMRLERKNAKNKDKQCIIS